ncbi:hypothetical protein DdX_22043 [Ditylenchus destructor]|uniref:FCD domain-containing protein n=1 Tax=Ditylenchus destructor TaxID=166010 RepID=A0AAD4QV50_9BILA|nr:hypothetical protein DdX_22043 [Ditylenchus destructor]
MRMGSRWKWQRSQPSGGPMPTSPRFAKRWRRWIRAPMSMDRSPPTRPSTPRSRVRRATTISCVSPSFSACGWCLRANFTCRGGIPRSTSAMRKKINRDHEAIYAPIETGDANAARRAARQHMVKSVKRYEKLKAAGKAV